MKTLVVYDKNTGYVSFTQTITGVEDVEYDTIIADIPDNKVVERVENGEVILENIPEVKEIKEKLKILNEEISKIKLHLLEDMLEG